MRIHYQPKAASRPANIGTGNSPEKLIALRLQPMVEAWRLFEHDGETLSFDDKLALMTDRLNESAWVRRHEHLFITGPTGVGKSYLACALAHKACRDGYSKQGS